MKIHFCEFLLLKLICAEVRLFLLLSLDKAIDKLLSILFVPFTVPQKLPLAFDNSSPFPIVGKKSVGKF